MSGIRRHIKRFKGKKDGPIKMLKGGASNLDHDKYHDIRIAKKLINEALDPHKAHGKVRTFADMTDEEKAALKAKHER